MRENVLSVTLVVRLMGAVLFAGVVCACGRGGGAMTGTTGLADFAARYTAAWCSHDAAAVAAFFEESGSLTINEGTPAVGRRAIEAAVQAFMTGYPDLVVRFDRLEPAGKRVLYHWTLSGTNTGPDGTGNRVQISGFEDWQLGPDGRIAASRGHYDAQDWDRQVKGR